MNYFNQHDEDYSDPRDEGCWNIGDLDSLREECEDIVSQFGQERVEGENEELDVERLFTWAEQEINRKSFVTREELVANETQMGGKNVDLVRAMIEAQRPGETPADTAIRLSEEFDAKEGN